MKKTLALVLAMVMWLSFAACASGETLNTNAADTAENAIVGEWKSLDGLVTAFNEGGTGTAPNGAEFSWTYDAGAEGYMLSLQGQAFSCKIENDGELCFIGLGGNIFYHADDYEKAKGENNGISRVEGDRIILDEGYFLNYIGENMIITELTPDN